MTGVLRRYLEEHRRLLTVLGAVLVGNVLFYGLLTAQFQREVRSRRQAHEESRIKVEAAFADYARAALEERLLATARTRIAELYRDVLQEKSERWPVVDSKMQELQARYRWDPHSLAFGYTEMKAIGLEEYTVSFRLKGSYADLRQLVSAFERATTDEGRDSFFVIDAVRLQDSTDAGKELNLTIKVSTYFQQPAAHLEVVKASEPSARKPRTRKTRKVSR